jgi:tetrahydromethanopterin S-methyltransferase subunit A
VTVIDFPSASRRRRKPYAYKRGPLVFCSYESIAESDEAALVKDVCSDMARAESKLRRVKQRLQNVLVESAAQVELLTAADAKLTAAIIAARGKDKVRVLLCGGELEGVNKLHLL